MRTALALLLCINSVHVLRADSSDDTLQYFLAKAEAAVVAEVTNQPWGVVWESGITNYSCDARVLEVLKPSKQLEKSFRVNVMRFDHTGGVPVKGSRYILFVKREPAGTTPPWVTADFWFGVLEYQVGTAQSIRRVAAKMQQCERWRPLRQISDDRTDENRAALMKLVDLRDTEVVCQALSRLSGYQPTPELTALVKRKMKDADRKIALRAAIASCYAGDSSGLELVLRHVTDPDPQLRRDAIGHLMGGPFHAYKNRVVPLLLERLRVESDPDLVRQVIETLGQYPSREVLAAIKPFEKHQSEQVRTQAKYQQHVILQSLQEADSRK